MAAKKYLKFSETFALQGTFQESQVIAELPLPIEISKVIEFIEQLEQGKWVKVGKFYIVKLETSTIYSLSNKKASQSHDAKIH